MIITYTDDKKEKYQSVRAELQLDFRSSMGDGTLSVESFGATNEEARTELLRVVICMQDMTRTWLRDQFPTHNK
jgi:hypothetical protein